MTRVRLEYLPTPGPAGTAVRVAGLMYDGFLIEVEAIAVIGSGELTYATYRGHQGCSKVRPCSRENRLPPTPTPTMTTCPTRHGDRRFHVL